MAKSVTLTLRVSEDIKAKLGRLAEATDRTPSALAQRALSAYVDQQLWMIEEIKQGQEDFREGRTVPHDEAMAQIQAILAEHKRDAA